MVRKHYPDQDPGLIKLAPRPSTEDVVVHENLAYARWGDRVMQLDLYVPSGHKKPLPLVIFLNEWDHRDYRNWGPDTMDLLKRLGKADHAQLTLINAPHAFINFLPHQAVAFDYLERFFRTHLKAGVDSAQPRTHEAEQDGAEQSASAPESRSEGDKKPKLESEGCSQ